MKTRVCTVCGKSNPADSWYCKDCGETLSIDSLVDDSPEAISEYKEEQKAKKETLPVGLELRQDSDQFKATYPWFSTARMIRAMEAPLVCLLTSILLFWGVFGLEGLSSLLDFVLLTTAVGLLVYGIWAAYLMICILLNNTTVNITRNELMVFHSPIPVRGNQSIKYCDISEFSIEEIKEKWFVPILVEGGPNWVAKSNLYLLKAKHRNGNWISLLCGPDYEIIHRLKLEMESFLANHKET